MPELEELEEVEALEELEADVPAELEVLADGVELTLWELSARLVDVVLDTAAAVVVFAAALFVAVRVSAGSWPVTSCTKMPPEVARNVAVARATTRVRITLVRCLRAFSRSATRSLAPDRAAARCAERRAAGEGRA